MIKRWYSLTVKKIHNDGKGSYSYNNHIVCWKSWKAEPNLVLEYQLKECEKKLSDIQGSEILEIVCFARI